MDLDHDRIALLAYRYWEERGRPVGSPEVDWDRATNTLRDQPQSKFSPYALSLAADESVWRSGR